MSRASTGGPIGLLSGPGGKIVVAGALALVVIGSGLLVWHRSRQRTAADALAGTEQTFLPEGMASATTPTSTPRATPATLPTPRPAPTQQPVEVSMAGSLPLDILSSDKPSTTPLGTRVNDTAPTVAQNTPGTSNPAGLPAAPAMPAPGQTGSPATAALDPANQPAPGTAAPTNSPSSPAATNPATNPAAVGEVKRLIDDATKLVQLNQPVAARKKLNDALFDARYSAADRGSIRAQLASINETLFFSPTIAAGDLIADTYTVQSGDSLARITRRQGLPIDWRLLQRINRMSSPNALRAGQKLKVIRLPIHAIVHKNDFRMDLYAGSPPANPGAVSADLGPDGQEKGWIYIRSFRVGLGEANGTPEGTFVVRPNSKLVNPRWINPRTGEAFEADDPANPIGEHWIGLDGADENTKQFTGYGVHGTIDAPSIGQQRSMGCVRLVAEDIAIVYELLVDRLSTVKIIK